MRDAIPTGEGIYPFEADLPLVIASKMEFVSDGGDFLFLRKGEAAGALEVAVYAARLLDPDIVAAGQFIAALGAKAAVVVGGVVAINKGWEVALKQFETFTNNVSGTMDLVARVLAKLRPENQPRDVAASDRLPRDMRILCSRTRENELAIPLLTAMGARIRHRPAEVSSGTHRFHVNRSRFVLHFRLPSDRFLGVTGSNPIIRERLRAEFLEEWERCAPDVKA